MELKKAKSLKQIINIYKLYRISFPKEERKPFWLILTGALRGNFELFSIEDSKRFKGLAITLKNNDLALLDYLAISPSEKGGGYGSRALDFLKDYYKGFRFFLEIENSSDEKAPNYRERQLRKKFYEKNGFSPLPFNVNLFGVNMEILGNNCSVDFDEYHNLYKHQFGGFMKKMIEKNVTLAEEKRQS